MILVVDPDNSTREQTREILDEAGFDTEGHESMSSARDALTEYQTEIDDSSGIDCLVTEYDLPDGTGLELIELTRDIAPDTTCVLFTEVSLEDIDTEEFGETVAEYIPKGGSEGEEELVDLIEHSDTLFSQRSYPLPKNEDARLAALDKYSEDSEELNETLDRLTELVRELFDVDIAFVGLVGNNKERFVSCSGYDMESLDREETICTHTIIERELIIVDDLEEDLRFQDYDVVQEWGVRFYAGAPLITDEGEAIGTFCVMDDTPREFSERDRELLSTLADEVMDQFELHRKLQSQGGDTDE